jgi:hypothetical protein
MDTSNTKQLLQEYYNITTDDIPTKRMKSQWEHDNKCGFLKGVLAYGLDTHRTQLHLAS